MQEARLQARAPVFRRSEKSPGGRQAKGWETAETAAAEVGAGQEAGTGYPPTPPHPAFLGCTFSPSPLLKPSNTLPKVGGFIFRNSDPVNQKLRGIRTAVRGLGPLETAPTAGKRRPSTSSRGNVSHLPG